MVKGRDIRIFCESFNIDNYEWKIYDLSDIGKMISFNDLLANGIREEQMKDGVELCLYDYSDLWEDLSEKTKDIIYCIEDKIFDGNETKIPLAYIESRCSEICSYIDSAFAEKYISDLIEKDFSDYSVDLTSNFHTRDEFNATLYLFYKDVLCKELDELKNRYKENEYKQISNKGTDVESPKHNNTVGSKPFNHRWEDNHLTHIANSLLELNKIDNTNVFLSVMNGKQGCINWGGKKTDLKVFLSYFCKQIKYNSQKAAEIIPKSKFPLKEANLLFNVNGEKLTRGSFGIPFQNEYDKIFATIF